MTDQASEHVDAVIPHSPVQEEVDIEWTEAEESAVRLKMDLRVVPLVTLLYLLCVSVPLGDLLGL